MYNHGSGLPTMRFAQTDLAGAFVVDLESNEDARGAFSRTFCEVEFDAHGLPTRFPQCNLSRNHLRGTLRGMHYEVAPTSESKLVRCTRGAIYDVIVDLREASPTFCRWTSAELTAENGRALFVPAGFAHGFITLEDRTDVFYHMGDVFRPGVGRGYRWNDPAFSISWPMEPSVISERDASYPDFEKPAQLR